MRILLITDCYLPSTKSVAQLIHDLAWELSRQGHDCTVLAPGPDVGARCEVSEEDGIRVIRYRAGPTKGVGWARRAVSEMTLSLAALLHAGRALHARPADLIVFYSPSIFFGPLVRHLKTAWEVPTYLVLRDIFPDWAVDTGVMRRGAVYHLFKGFERIQYAAADVIGVETTGSLSYFETQPYPERRVELLRNWTVVDRPPRAGSSARAELGLRGKVVFFFGGNMGVAQDLDNLLRLARRMACRPDAHFLFVGDGSERARIEHIVDTEEISNATVLGPVAPDRYLEILSEADVGMISLDRRLKSFSTTGKLLGYLRCGLPVLASYNPGNDLDELLRDSGAGLGAVNGDDDALFAHATELCNADVRASMTSAARALLKSDFAVGQAAERILLAARGA